jgi:prepilin-type N-terminal cleavage/methylation domain-containing protein
MKNHNQKGFTLVELSIVLVIIGLLIGGILAAQSMIETTKIQAFTRQIGQFDAAVVNFGDKFGGLPGDTSAFDAAGDDDGIIEATDGTTVTDEAARVWNNLSLSGLKREEGSGEYGTAGTAVGTDWPRAKVGSAGNGVLAYGEATPTVLENLGSAANLYIIADCSAMTNTTLSCISGLSGSQSIAIDAKMDDGVGTTGNVTGLDLAGPVATWAGLSDGTEAAYAAGNDQDEFGLFIRMGLATGVLK